MYTKGMKLNCTWIAWLITVQQQDSSQNEQTQNIQNKNMYCEQTLPALEWRDRDWKLPWISFLAACWFQPLDQWIRSLSSCLFGAIHGYRALNVESKDWYISHFCQFWCVNCMELYFVNSFSHFLQVYFGSICSEHSFSILFSSRRGTFFSLHTPNCSFVVCL